MNKLPEVETARALMAEAVSWSVMKWLREKKRVRKTADQANAALDHRNEAVKERWPEALRAAYQALDERSTGSSRNQPKKPPSAADPETALLAKKLKDSDDEAYRARMDAETTFDEAERQLSTALAREGCRKAIHSWDMYEKAIRKAEAAIESK